MHFIKAVRDHDIRIESRRLQVGRQFVGVRFLLKSAGLHAVKDVRFGLCGFGRCFGGIAGRKARFNCGAKIVHCAAEVAPPIIGVAVIAAIAQRVRFLMADDIFDRNIKRLAKINAIFDRHVIHGFEIFLVLAIVFAHFKLNVRGVVVVRTLRTRTDAPAANIIRKNVCDLYFFIQGIADKGMNANFTAHNRRRVVPMIPVLIDADFRGRVDVTFQIRVVCPGGMNDNSLRGHFLRLFVTIVLCGVCGDDLHCASSLFYDECSS